MTLSLLLALPLTTSVCLKPVPPSTLADIFVDTSISNCATGTGAAGSPVCSISAAVAIAAPGDTIRIAPGTYLENVVLDFDLELIGTGGASVTTIDGGGAGSVVSISKEVIVTMDGLTVTNGSAPTGGGIRVLGSLALSNSTISGNVATATSGGGIGALTSGTTLTVNHSTFENNTAAAQGGAIFAYDGICRVRNSIFVSNSAFRGGGGVTFSGYPFPGNSLEIVDSTFIGNSATAAPSLFSGGGAVFFNGGRFLLRGTTFSENSAGRWGGGIYASGNDFEISQSTFSQNVALFGGGIYCNSFGGPGEKRITQSTFTENTASVNGGGVFTLFAEVEVGDSIVAGNSSGGSSKSAGADIAGSTFQSLGHNLIGIVEGGFVPNTAQGDLVGSTTAPLGSLLGPLQDNGGPTETHALLAGSPALDAGNPSVIALSDQRGRLRPEGTRSDIGAIEEGASGLCNGDGGNGMGCTPCPCGNDSPPGTVGGCLNSTGLGGELLVLGSPSLGDSSLSFEARHLPPSSVGLLLSGTELAPANPSNPCFGLNSGITFSALDGLRCVVQGIERHGIRAANANGQIGATTSGWDVPNLFGFQAFLPGQTRYFQVTYRDDLAEVCLTGLNTTQSAQVTFVP